MSDGGRLRACDFLSLNGYKLLWGPGRHGIGHNIFAYHRAPNGLITELFAQLDQMNEELGYFEPRPWHRDRPQRPKVWARPSASNYWGILPTDEMHKSRTTPISRGLAGRSMASISQAVTRLCGAMALATTFATAPAGAQAPNPVSVIVFPADLTGRSGWRKTRAIFAKGGIEVKLTRRPTPHFSSPT